MAGSRSNPATMGAATRLHPNVSRGLVGSRGGQSPVRQRRSNMA